MTSGFAISALIPTITSNSIFSSRRANSSIDAMSANNPFVAAMNMDIAGGQATNLAKSVSDVAKASKGSIASGIISAEESIKAMAKGDKVIKGVGKVLNFTADHINHFICATSAVKVLCSDDKKEAAIKEGLGLGTMFAFENITKSAVGIPLIKDLKKDDLKVCNDGLYSIKNGKKCLVAGNGKYKLLNNNKVAIERGGFFFKKQVSALEQYCATKKLFNKSLKFLPGCLKGLAFVTASIGGYNLGLAAANLILEKTSS